MINRTAGQLAKACNGELFNCELDRIINKIVNNDKLSENNCAYIAINGENYSGIDFAGNACKNGAVLIISESLSSEALPTLLVKDVKKALWDIARECRRAERETVVAVTGSAGKTTVKELCHGVLEQKAPTIKSEGNKNNLIGLPLALLSFADAKTAVIEAGISEIGEMSILSSIAEPNIAVITNIGHMHAQTLGSRESIAREKLKILKHADRDCILIVPENEPLLSVGLKNTVTVSPHGVTADYSADNIKFSEKGSFFDILKRGVPYINDAFVPIIGEHGVTDALFAAAVGDRLGVPSVLIKQAITEYKGTENRQNIITENGITVMSDCYNFGPESAHAALSAFSILCDRIAPKRKILMLGSMLELGDDAENMHIELGREIAGMGFDFLITLGDIAKNIALGAMMRGMENVFDYGDLKRDEAAKKLTELATERAAILVKGSRKMKLEEFVSLII